MSNADEKLIRLNIQLTGDVADRFRRIKTFLGLENDTEVVRTLIAWYHREYEKDLTGPPKTMWHMNLRNEGVLVWDPDLSEAVLIHFQPQGMRCEKDSSSDCRHIQFALSKPDIQTVIRKKRKEGWKLPEV